jgi:dTDP-4-amino-4,6-dideoxygalactose transaminase
LRVPFFDIKQLHAPIQDDLNRACERVIASGRFILGSELEQFEAAFAEYSGVTHCVGVGNGLDALTIILASYDIGPGDEVIVPANTFIASWLAISHLAASIVPVEPLEGTQNIDPSKIEALITPNTVAIMPVHLYGQPADMDAINAIATKHQLLVIADGAQSHGASYHGKPVSALADATAVSFYPGKNLGALGDGGGILTNDTTLASRCRQYRNYGTSLKYHNDMLGSNSRLDEIQAAVLNVKLPWLDEWNSRRDRLASIYNEKLSVLSKLKLPVPAHDIQSVWHQYVVHTEHRDALQAHLDNLQVETLIHYPVPPHKQACYRGEAWPALPITESLAETCLSLPISPELTFSELSSVVDGILAFHDEL